MTLLTFLLDILRFDRAEVGLVCTFWTVEVGDVMVVILFTNVAQVF